MEKQNTLIQTICKIREEGLNVPLKKPIANEMQAVIMAALLHLWSETVIKTVELVEQQELIGMAIATEESQIEAWKRKFDKAFADNDKVLFMEEEYGNNEKQKQKLFNKLGLEKLYEVYVENSLPNAKAGLARIDSEKQKEAEKLFNILNPVVDERGHLLLAEDGAGNAAWAFVMRNNAGGKLSYGIYRMTAGGQVSTSTIISPSAVNGMTMKIGNTIADYDGGFTSQQGIQATQRLWLWNISRKFKVTEALNDYNPTEVYELLKEWIYKNVDTVYYEGTGENITARKPVYVEKMKGRLDIGIWVDDFDYVFEKLDITNLSTGAWISEALKEEYVVPVFTKNKAGEESKRAGYNPYKGTRDEYGRLNKNERVYRIAFTEEEEAKVWKKHEENLAKLEKKKVEAAQDKIETDLSKKPEKGEKNA